MSPVLLTCPQCNGSKGASIRSTTRGGSAASSERGQIDFSFAAFDRTLDFEDFRARLEAEQPAGGPQQ
jgi:hypothetical protein